MLHLLSVLVLRAPVCSGSFSWYYTFFRSSVGDLCSLFHLFSRVETMALSGCGCCSSDSCACSTIRGSHGTFQALCQGAALCWKVEGKPFLTQYPQINVVILQFLLYLHHGEITTVSGDVFVQEGDCFAG